MYTCDKCGCEHNSTTTCPKCGAPVVRINEDYLRRKKEWEEKQFTGITIATSKGRKNIDMRPKTAKEDKEEEVKEGPGFLVSLISNIKETIARKKRHKNDKQLEELDEEDDNKDMYEKLILDHVVAKSRRKRFAIIFGGVFAIIFVILLIYYIVSSIDRSDVVYFDGYEFYSANDGVFCNITEIGNYKLKGYDDRLDTLVFEKDNDLYYDEQLAVWQDGKITKVDAEGTLTGQCIFSDNGEFFTYITYEEEDNKADKGLYRIYIVDTKTLKEFVYDSSMMLNILHITDDGRVIFTQMDTTEYSVVVSTRLMIGSADGVRMICQNAKDSAYLSNQDEVAFIHNENLYICPVDKSTVYAGEIFAADRFYELIAEEVINCKLDEFGEHLYFFDDRGMYAVGEEIRLVCPNATNAYNIYEINGTIYYQYIHDLYCIDKNGINKVITRVAYILRYENGMLCLDENGNLYQIDKGCKLIRDNVMSIGKMYGRKGFSIVIDKTLYYAKPIAKDFDYIKVADSNISGKTDIDILLSKKYYYYIDSSNVLWKIGEKNGNAVSLGFVQNALFKGEKH